MWEKFLLVNKQIIKDCLSYSYNLLIIWYKVSIKTKYGAPCEAIANGQPHHLVCNIRKEYKFCNKTSVKFVQVIHYVLPF